MVLGQKPGADKLPKKLTDTLQDPKNPKTKVPLKEMLVSYYSNRQWVNGVPTRKVLKRLGIDIPSAEEFPYAY